MKNPKRIHYVMLSVNILLVLGVFGVVFLGDKILKQHSDELINNKLQNNVLEQDQLALIRARKDIEQYKELATVAKQIVPQEKDQAATVREIVQLAKKANVVVGSVIFPTSNLGSPNSKPDVLTQAEPVKGINGLLSLDITVASNPDFPSNFKMLNDFLVNLENNRRTSQVSGIIIQPDSKNNHVLNFVITLRIYIKP